MIIPIDSEGNEIKIKDIIPADMRFQQNTELLEVMRDAFISCTEQCQKHIDFISNYEEGRRLALSRHFAATLEKTLAKTENLLFTYEEHLPLNPYDVWDYILENQEPGCGNYGINILEDCITIHIPRLEMPHRSRSGNSLVERILATLVRKNIDRFPNWHNWQAKFYLVFPLSTSAIPRDVDNYNYKRIIDLLAFGLGSSDNAIHFAMSMETLFTDKIASGVYIEITPRSLENPVLPNWQKRGRGRPKGSKDKQKRQANSTPKTRSKLPKNND